MVLVMHGHFIDTLLKALLGMALLPTQHPVATDQNLVDPESLGAADAETHVKAFRFPNTATALLDVYPANEDGNGEVLVKWIGRVDHLQQGADAALPSFVSHARL